jgi:hypothetical protein
MIALYSSTLCGSGSISRRSARSSRSCTYYSTAGNMMALSSFVASNSNSFSQKPR